MKKRLSLFLVFILFLTNINLNKAYANSSEDEAYRKAEVFLAQVYQINKELSKYGLDLNYFKQFANKDEQFFKDMLSYSSTNSTTDTILNSENILGYIQNSAPTSYNIEYYMSGLEPESLETAQRWSYAEKMARINNKRDKNAKDKSKETTYMYMSHFVDIREGRKIKVDSSISDDGYFAAWITNDDRRVYDVYLKGAKAGESIKSATHTVTSVVGFFLSGKGFNELDTVSKTLENIVKWGATPSSLVLSESDYISNAKEFAKIVSESEHSREAMDRFEKSIANQYNDEKKREAISKFFVNVILSGLSSGINGVIATVGLATIDLTVDIYKDFFDRVWWISLVRTNSLRVSYRIMRNQGWI